MSVFGSFAAEDIQKSDSNNFRISLRSILVYPHSEFEVFAGAKPPHTPQIRMISRYNSNHQIFKEV